MINSHEDDRVAIATGREVDCAGVQGLGFGIWGPGFRVEGAGV